MIKWVLFFAGCLGIVQLSGQSKKLIRTYGITTVTETVIEYEDEVEKRQYVSERIKFDKRGEWIEKTTFEKDGSVELRLSRKYDRDILIEEVEEEAPQKEKKAKDASFKKDTYVYDKADLKEHRRYEADGKLKWTLLFTYNKYGDKVREEKLDENGNLEEVEVFFYDNRGFKTSKITTDKDGVMTEKKMYTYE
jgi:hypothetical protein